MTNLEASIQRLFRKLHIIYNLKDFLAVGDFWCGDFWCQEVNPGKGIYRTPNVMSPFNQEAVV